MKTKHIVIAAAAAAFGVAWARSNWLAYNGSTMQFEWVGPPMLSFLGWQTRPSL